MPARPIAVFLHDTVGLISGVVRGSLRRIAAASSLQNADGTVDVTVTGTRLDTSSDVVSSVLPTGAATEATLDSIKDVDGVKKITDPVQVSDGVDTLAVESDGAVRARLYDSAGVAFSSQDDAGVIRQEISGKVSVIGAVPPPSTNDATIFADTPLIVGSHDTTFVIPSGQTYHLQEVVMGNEDPTKGASVEVLYDDGAEHLVARVYRSGFTATDGLPDRTTARDGTTMTGNGTNAIIVRRAKFSGTNIAIDAVVRGYTS